MKANKKETDPWAWAKAWTSKTQKKKEATGKNLKRSAILSESKKLCPKFWVHGPILICSILEMKCALLTLIFYQHVLQSTPILWNTKKSPMTFKAD